MPFHLPPQRRPVGPSVVPVVSERDGSRRIRMSFMLGPDFTADDVRVERHGRTLSIRAGYDAEIGLYGSQVSRPGSGGSRERCPGTKLIQVTAKNVGIVFWDAV